MSCQEPLRAVGQNPKSVGSTLCTHCGLCCTGALHNYAVLDQDETAFARNLGMTLRTEGRPGFLLPCPRLDGSLCSIYRDRPKVCGRYKCGLLEGVEASPTALDSALVVVEQAKDLICKAESLLPEGMTLPQARAALWTPVEAPGSQSDALSAQARLALFVACFHIDKHFKNEREAKLLAPRPVEGQAEQMEMV